MGLPGRLAPPRGVGRGGSYGKMKRSSGGGRGGQRTRLADGLAWPDCRRPHHYPLFFFVSAAAFFMETGFPTGSSPTPVTGARKEMGKVEGPGWQLLRSPLLPASPPAHLYNNGRHLRAWEHFPGGRVFAPAPASAVGRRRSHRSPPQPRPNSRRWSRHRRYHRCYPRRHRRFRRHCRCHFLCRCHCRLIARGPLRPPPKASRDRPPAATPLHGAPNPLTTPPTPSVAVAAVQSPPNSRRAYAAAPRGRTVCRGRHATATPVLRPPRQPGRLSLPCRCTRPRH